MTEKDAMSPDGSAPRPEAAPQRATTAAAWLTPGGGAPAAGAAPGADGSGAAREVTPGPERGSGDGPRAESNPAGETADERGDGTGRGADDGAETLGARAGRAVGDASEGIAQPGQAPQGQTTASQSTQDDGRRSPLPSPMPDALPNAGPNAGPDPLAEAARRAAASPLLAEYKVPDGVADELMSAPGVVRPVWHPLLARLAEMTPEEIARRFARGDQYLRDAGVYFRHYVLPQPTERDWPLSHIPVILDESEWATISTGLTERADLLERIVADIYGPQDLVKEGHLPAELLALNPEWLRPMMGVTPRGGHYLHFLAFEIGRNPDGSWFVLGDRTQAPSGAGFALENRMATSRVFSDFYAKSNVHRLAGFFRQFRNALDGLRDNLEGALGGRPAILTPGPNTDTYFEHVYIARYLGLMLLEGEDLTVVDGKVMVRTVAGPMPISVLWRRMDAAFADPLELNETSHIGTPGLVSALRNGSVTMLNALGSGVLETRAMMAFVPRIAQIWLGRKLALPNIATWWCGHEPERAYVKTHKDRMMIGQALSCQLPFDVNTTTAFGGGIRDRARASVDDWIEAEAGALVGQEAVSLSTTPSYEEGRLVPRPMTVRVFAARTPKGWAVMPGGYARIGRSGDATALAMQRGGSVADVWIASQKPVATDTLTREDGSLGRTDVGALPARAADNLFWLGRYIERTESIVRMLRAYHLRLAESGDPQDSRVLALAADLKLRGVDVSEELPQALPQLLGQANACAGKVRDRFSVDGWAALQDMAKTLRKMSTSVEAGDDAARAMSVLLRKIAGFSGLVNENMYRFTGWRFLEIGRAMERADFLTSILLTFADPAAPEGSLDIAIELADSVMTHRRRYHGPASRPSVIDLLALDRRNPRAILFQLELIREMIAELPRGTHGTRLTELERQILRLSSEVTLAKPDEVSSKQLNRLRRALGDFYLTLAQDYLH